MGRSHRERPGLDVVYRALADPLRRAALARLHRSPDDATTLDDLSERVAGSVEGLAASRAAVALHHVHLPTLAELGFVEYDARSGAVRYEPPRFATPALDAALAKCPAAD